MINKCLVYVLFFLLFVTTALQAQQSSKSKSKERFREKDFPENKVAVVNVTILNSANTDYSPTYYQNGLVYVSSWKKNGARDKRTGETFSELYFAPFDPNGFPAGRQNFSLDINSKLHEGPVTFSRDNKTMFYTQNNQKDGVQKADSKGVVHLKIYAAKKGPLDWIPQGELPFNSDEYSCLHPSLSADGKRLYFSSDMPGGIGGYDIYYAVRAADGSWSAPVNAGSNVNTDKNELFPFIHPNGALFFSSTGHENNLGGLDIFMLEKDRDGNEAIVNMNRPYNSPEDDLGFIIDDEFRRGFFTSNRVPDEKGLNGTKGKDDIWSFSIEQGIKDARPATREATIVVRDAKTGKPVQGAEIRILKSSRDGFVDADSSIYEIDLQPVGDDRGSVNLQLRPKSSDKMRHPDLYSNAAGEAGADFLRYRSYVIMVNHKDYQVTQQFVSVDDEPGQAHIDIKLSTAPVCFWAKGTVLTDQLGTRIANANLKFIHKASNKIQTGRTNLNGEYEVCLPEPGEYLVQTERGGFQPDNFTFIAYADRPDFHETRLRPTIIGGEPSQETASAGAVQDGSVIVMDKIVFEPNQTTLNQTAIRNLDALFELMMRYPNITVDLVAHTDSRGNQANNLEISKQRAENALAYLEHRGIKEGRINAIGKGGSVPRNHCLPGVACSEEEYQANVRIEANVHLK
jgi:outer membrane protein OmpA-like peptidoglycan-associated protein